ncbi:TonB-dependent receptor plug domain-containing protein [Desulfobacca acetoxidans]
MGSGITGVFGQETTRNITISSAEEEFGSGAAIQESAASASREEEEAKKNKKAKEEKIQILASKVSGSEDVVGLEEVVVTATRTKKDVETAPGSVSVVTSGEIERRYIKTIDEAVNTLPGVYDRRSTGLLDPIGRIQLRGLPGSERTLLLQDGITLNDPYSGGQKDMLGITPENVDRIEVVRGPFSSLYGGYAMGGVVNVITKMPEKREFVLKGGYGTSMPGADGLDNLWRVYGSYGDKFFDKLSTFISFGYRATDGFTTDFNVASKAPPAGISGWSYTTNTQGAIRYLIGDKGVRNWWDHSLTLKAKYDFTDVTSLRLSFTRTCNEYEFDAPKTYLHDNSGKKVWSYSGVKESSFLAGLYGWEGINSSACFETEFSPVTVKLTTGILVWEKSWNTVPGSSATLSGGPGTVSDSPLQAYNSELQFTLPVWSRHLLTFGGTFRHSNVDVNTYNLTDWLNKDSTTTLSYEAKGQDLGFSLFLQDEITILENLTAYIGIREDWWQTYDGYANDVGKKDYPMYFSTRSASYFSPKGSLVYKPFGKTTLRASIGQAFRPPTVYELYRTYTGSYGTVYASNPDLKPETTTSWDAGVEQRLWKGAKIAVTYFDNHIDDLIYSTATDPSLSRYEKENAGKATSQGVEVEIEQKVASWMRLFANFTYTDAKITENAKKPETVGKRLTDVPECMYNVGAYFSWKRLSGSLIGRYVGKSYSTDENTDTVNHVFGSYDPFFVADMKVAYAFTPSATLSFSIDNMFNEKYYLYRRAPGTSWFLEMMMKF